MKQYKFIISGGGTGGHIFPAISIANALKLKYPDAEILFVGAENRMEMERVPAAGYRIIGLPVAGFDRKNPLKNIPVLIKLRKCLALAKKTIREFNPDVAIGVGGYASGPTLRMAAKLGIPTLLQEQNSYAGVTNKLLAKKAARICVAYENMESFFPKDKIILTGNPVRQDLEVSEAKRKEAHTHFGLHPDKRTIVVLGGSLGAGTVNESILAAWDALSQQNDVQLLWQTGKYYYKGISERVAMLPANTSVVYSEFISRMDLAYSVADLIISRAGAGSISEFSLLGKAVVLVPSPNVAEDHQTKNAMALVSNGAAHMVADKDAVSQLIPQALELINNPGRLDELRTNIRKMALPDSARIIVEEIEKLLDTSP
jgi:undecaprenyldiphospho-muramoylpentapeptide beta-N-acetylglucosaminyltransferase